MEVAEVEATEVVVETVGQGAAATEAAEEEEATEVAEVDE